MTLIAALDGVVSPSDSVETGNGILKFYNKYEVKDSNRRIWKNPISKTLKFLQIQG